MSESTQQTTNATTEQNARALDVLRTVIDPEIGMNIVDLGLVYEATVKSDYVYVQMTMTTAGCPMHESITGAAKRALEQAFPGIEVNVHLVWEPAWTPARLSPAAKEKLGFPG